MRKVVLFILISFAVSQLSGQQSGISFTGGIGTYELNDLKSYHNDLLTRLPVEASAFDYFPPYTNLRINLYRQEESGFKYGLAYAFSGSGAHANYTDYSGSLDLDQQVSAYQLGASAGYNLLSIDFFITQFEILAYGDIRMSYIRDKVMMNISTRYYSENNMLVLNTFSPGAELGLEVLFSSGDISLGVEGGYYFDSGAKFRVGEESNSASYVLLEPSGELRIDLSGFRIGLKLIKRLDLELFAE